MPLLRFLDTINTLLPPGLLTITAFPTVAAPSQIICSSTHGTLVTVTLDGNRLKLNLNFHGHVVDLNGHYHSTARACYCPPLSDASLAASAAAQAVTRIWYAINSTNLIEGLLDDLKVTEPSFKPQAPVIRRIETAVSDFHQAQNIRMLIVPLHCAPDGQPTFGVSFAGDKVRFEDLRSGKLSNDEHYTVIHEGLKLGFGSQSPATNPQPALTVSALRQRYAIHARMADRNLKAAAAAEAERQSHKTALKAFLSGTSKKLAGLSVTATLDGNRVRIESLGGEILLERSGQFTVTGNLAKDPSKLTAILTALQ